MISSTLRRELENFKNTHQTINDLVEQIIKTDDLNIQTKDKMNILFYAIFHDKIELVELLIKNGADINKQDYRGWTALHYAAFFERLEILKLLLNANADTTLTDGQFTALDTAKLFEKQNSIDVFNNPNIEIEKLKEAKQKEKILDALKEEDKAKTAQEILDEARNDFAKRFLSLK